MPHRFPPLAPQEPVRARSMTRAMARALPAPANLRWLDLVVFSLLICGIRLL